MTKRDLARLTKFRDVICEAYQVLERTERIYDVSNSPGFVKYERKAIARTSFVNLVGVMVKKELRRGKR